MPPTVLHLSLPALYQLCRDPVVLLLSLHGCFPLGTHAVTPGSLPPAPSPSALYFTSDAIGSALSSLQGLATTVGASRNELLAGVNRLSQALDRDSGREERRNVDRLRCNLHLLRTFERNNMVDGAAPPDQAFQMMVCKLLSSSDPETARFLKEAEHSFKLFRVGTRSEESRALPVAARACFNCGGAGHAARNCPSPPTGTTAHRGVKRRADGPISNMRPPPSPQQLPTLTWNGPAGPLRPLGGSF